MIRIAIVEDHTVFREGLCALLSQDGRFTVVKETASGEEFEAWYSPVLVDIILLDLRLIGQSGAITCRNLCKKNPQIKIIVLSLYADGELMLEMIRNGASGYCSKSESISKIIHTICSVHEHGFYFDMDLGLLMRNELAKAHKKRISGNSFTIEFTKTELQVAIFFCNQNSNAEIAEKLNISVRTVEGHKKVMTEKTNSRTFVGAVIYLLKNHIIFPEDFDSDAKQILK